jgi:hypothetical protein
MQKLRRGKYVLPHQSQTLGRDLCFETICQYPGAQVDCYARSDEEYEQAVARGDWRYRYFVFSPASPSLSWQTFRTLEDLREWCSAYGMTVEGEAIRPGESFHIVFPDRAALTDFRIGALPAPTGQADGLHEDGEESKGNEA